MLVDFDRALTATNLLRRGGECMYCAAVPSVLGDSLMSGMHVELKPEAEHGRESRADTWRAIAVSGFLVLAILLVFSRTLSQGFSSFDDPIYVYGEPHVSNGISLPGIVWALCSGPVGDWCPLAMLSHMLDCQLYGLNPAGHHLTNLLLHAASAMTLFVVLWRMTGQRAVPGTDRRLVVAQASGGRVAPAGPSATTLWPSALVAALFALHPLRVESVAWVAERRDVLSGLFFTLTLGAYGEYVRRPDSLGRYLAVVGLFALDLMAKPIVVTLPPLLLLLDYWPLGRFRRILPEAAAASVPPAPFPWRVVLDKLPLLALSFAAAVMTMLTHAASSADPLTLPERLANAAVSYVAYLGQLFVPMGLSPFYSYPEAGWPAWQVAAAVALLLTITAAAVIGRRSYPYFFVGWFWYIGMLVPVLGLTHAWSHARADRYTYLSQIGLYLALVWGAMRLLDSWPARRWAFGVGAALVLAALMAGTWRQTGYWQDDQTLWARALACDPKSATALCSLGAALEKKDDRGAAAQYRQVLEMEPGEPDIYKTVRVKAHCGLGSIALRAGDIAEAIAQYEQALALDPNFTIAHLNLGGLLATQGKLDKAIFHFRRSVELQPGNAPIYYSLAIALAGNGQKDEAIANLHKALAIDPSFSPAKQSLQYLLNH